MIVNLKIALRRILRNKIQSAISILGLGIGLGSILLLAMLYVHEKSFDTIFPDHENLYRVIQGKDCLTAYPLGEAIKGANPQVKNFFRFYQVSEVELKNRNNELVKDKLLAFSDPSIFQCLGISFKYGVPAQSESELTISEKTEKKYFNQESGIGKTLNIKLNEKFISLTVTGVFHDFPSNSTLSPEFIAPISLAGESIGLERKQIGQYNAGYEEWLNWYKSLFYTYLQLSPSAIPEDVVKGMQPYKALSKDEKRQTMDFSLQSVTDIYLSSEELSGNQFVRQGNAKELVYYIGIAMMIMLLAMANYIFLSKADIDSRLKELGVKKALGAHPKSILSQIIFESNLVSVLSLFPAIVVILAGYPFINSTLNKTLDQDVLSILDTWILLVFIILFVGSITGVLIGSRVSRISSVFLLKGKTTGKSRTFGNAFLSLHFILFIALMVCVFAVKKQINFSLTNFKAIDPSEILICELNSSELAKQIQVIKDEVDKVPGVVRSAGSSFIPPFNNYLPINLQYEGENIAFDGLIMGKGMIGLLGLQLLGGTDFDDFKEGQTDIIINESAALKYKLEAGAIFNGFRVKGIVKDFNAHSMRYLVKPMVILQQHPEKMTLLAIKTTGTNDTALVQLIHRLFKRISPNQIVHVYALSDQINQFYEHEQNQAKLIGAFSILAVILSMMGLLGMTHHTVLKRTKEIGIRKVNGATISEVLWMLNTNFIKWVAVAFVIATPLSFLVVQKWMEGFAYKTTLSWWLFALAGLIALVVAVVTVSWQSLKAARQNPVKSLRNE
jgi:putative ABC transport system permease protein